MTTRTKAGGRRRKARSLPALAKHGPRLTPEVVAQVQQVLPRVLYLETAADCLGVHRSTMQQWFKRGRREQLRLAEPKARPRASEQLYLEFAIAYQRGLADAEMKASEAIQEKAANGDWRAAAWLLERRSPERWSDKRRDKREGKRDGQAENDGERFAARLLGDPVAAELAGRLFERLVLGESDSGGAGPSGEPRAVDSSAASNAALATSD